MAERFDLTRAQARSLIMEGRVRVDGVPAMKPGLAVRDGAQLELERPRRFVSRGGEKLDAALDAFRIDVTGARCLDIGASTGGFTDCLLQRGAIGVVAVDVGYGQLDWRLRNDARVEVMERTNFRYLSDDALLRPFDMVVADVSFISLKTIAARAVRELAEGGAFVALVKPQFEAGRDRLGRGGVVRDPEVHAAVLREVRDAMDALGLVVVDAIASPLLGPAGNREFLIHMRRQGQPVSDAALRAIAIPEEHS